MIEGTLLSSLVEACSAFDRFPRTHTPENMAVVPTQAVQESFAMVILFHIDMNQKQQQGVYPGCQSQPGAGKIAGSFDAYAVGVPDLDGMDMSMVEL